MLPAAAQQPGSTVTESACMGISQAPHPRFLGWQHAGDAGRGDLPVTPGLRHKGDLSPAAVDKHVCLLATALASACHERCSAALPDIEAVSTGCDRPRHRAWQRPDARMTAWRSMRPGQAP